jgi:hypothetical protein
LAVSVPALWLNRIVFDTDTWVETVAPLAEDPAIQDAVATAASDAIIEQLDAEQRIRDLLPDEFRLDQFAPMLASSVESAVRSQTLKLVQSEQFVTIWTEINRKGHEALIASITGREGIVSVQSGTFTLDTGLLIDEVKTRLEDRGLDFVSRIPTAPLDKTIVLYESDAIAAAGPILDAIQKAAFWLPVLGLALVAGAFGLAGDRRKVALWLGMAVAVLAIMPLQFLYLAQYYAVRQVEELALIPSAAAQNAFAIIFRDLVTADRTLAVLGLVVWFGAVIAGPARWATALRSGLSGGLSSASSHLELGAFGRWVAAHKRGLRGGGFAAAALVLLALPAPRTIGNIVWIAVGVVVWIVAVEFFGAEPDVGAMTPAEVESPPAAAPEAAVPATEAGEPAEVSPQAPAEEGEEEAEPPPAV